MKLTCALIILGFLFSGCNSQINSFVQGAVRPTPVPIAESTGSDKAIKISPGSVRSTGSEVRAKATITPSNRILKGSQIQAKLSISQSRKN